MAVPFSTSTFMICVVMLIPFIPSAIHRNAAALLSIVTTATRLLQPWRPSELMKGLDDILEEIQQRLDDCKEQGGSIHEFDADTSFTQMQIEASLLRVQTIPIDSSLQKECWAFCRGLSLSILRCINDAESLHGEILRVIELHKQKRLQDYIKTSRGTGGISISSNDVAVISSPGPCVIASHLGAAPPSPSGDVVLTVNGPSDSAIARPTRPNPCVIATHLGNIPPPSPGSDTFDDTLTDFLPSFRSTMTLNSTSEECFLVIIRISKNERLHSPTSRRSTRCTPTQTVKLLASRPAKKESLIRFRSRFIVVYSGGTGYTLLECMYESEAFYLWKSSL